MNEYEIMTPLNNAVFTTEDIYDKVNELARNYDFTDCKDVGVDLLNDDEETISIMLMGDYNIRYVVGFSEIDDKFSKLIIRKVK